MNDDNALTERLLNHLWKNGRFAYFYSLPSKHTQWHSLDAKQITCTMIEGQNTYFGVNPNATINGYRGRCDEIAALNCLFAEYDVKDYGSKAAILEHIATLQHSPSCLIDSGGGFHCYWLLKDSFIIDSEDQRQYAKRAQNIFATHAGGDAVKDLARVLRLPGSVNYKYSPARPVGFVGTEFNALYSIDDLIAGIPDQKPAEPRSAKLVGCGDGPIGRFNRALRIEQVLETYGYTQHGKKWLHPVSSTGIAGVVIGDTLNDDRHANQCFSHNGSDPLCDGYWHSPFDALRLLEFRGDFNATLAAVKSRELR